MTQNSIFSSRIISFTLIISNYPTKKGTESILLFVPFYNFIGSIIFPVDDLSV